jgi:hypothetical protein
MQGRSFGILAVPVARTRVKPMHRRARPNHYSVAENPHESQ